MTLVVLGLLLGMAGLLWVMVIDIMQADHQTKQGDFTRAEQAARGGSALRVQGSLARRNRRGRKVRDHDADCVVGLQNLIVCSRDDDGSGSCTRNRRFRPGRAIAQDRVAQIS